MIPDFKRLTEIAFTLLDKTSLGRCQHFSFILNKSKILSIGINDYKKTHPKTKEFNYHPNAKVHSEMAASLRLGLDCAGLTIVNIRIDKQNKITNSCPCSGCQDLIKSLKFRCVYYSNEYGQFVKMVK